jgi:hypothetical protein
MTLPQGLWFAAGTAIQSATLTATTPITAVITPTSVAFNLSVGSTLNCQTAYLTTDITSTAVSSSSIQYQSMTPLFSYTYTVPSPNMAIQIRLICSAETSLSTATAAGPLIAVFASNSPTSPPLSCASLRPYSGAGTAVATGSLDFTYNASGAALPATVTFYVAGASSTGSPITFISNTSTYFGGLSPTSISFNAVN